MWNAMYRITLTPVGYEVKITIKCLSEWRRMGEKEPMTSELSSCNQGLDMQPELRHGIRLIIIITKMEERATPHEPSVKGEFVGRSVTTSLPSISVMSSSGCLAGMISPLRPMAATTDRPSSIDASSERTEFPGKRGAIM